MMANTSTTYTRVQRSFIVTILENDLEEKYREDIEGRIKEAIGKEFGLDDGVSYSVMEVA